VSVGFRITSADLDTLPDIPGIRYEIIDGELYVAHQPTLGHQHAGGRIYRALGDWSDETDLGTPYLAPGLVLAEDQNVIPDVVWISHARQAEAEDASGHLRLAPELVIEVLSPGPANEVCDRELKLSLYSRQGVQEYWIADWQRHRVEVFRRTDGGLQLVVTLGDDDTLTSPLLPGFSCLVASLWPAARP
jgi:Uma2 family endonuclease